MKEKNKWIDWTNNHPYLEILVVITSCILLSILIEGLIQLSLWRFNN